MNEIITTSRFKQLIIKASGSDPAFVNLFVDDLILLIQEMVKNGEDVAIEGWGTFRLVKVGSTQYKRIVFFPDSKMKEGVNAPFAQFEPIVLKEATARPAAQKVIPAQELNDLPLVNTSEAEAEAFADVVEKEDIKMRKDPDGAGDDKNPAKEEAEAKKYREEMAQAEEPVEVSDGNGDLTEKVDQVVDQSVAEETGEPCTPTACPASTNLTSKRYGLWFVIILLAICILGTMVYFVMRIDRSDKMPASIEQVQQPSDKIAPIAVIPDDSISTPLVVEPVQDLPAPAASEKATPELPQTITLKRGERLTLLSLRYYGSKFFWVYIYEANKKKYPDPEEIPAGAILKIPAPEEYGIDKNNPQSLEKAKQKAANILGW
ncbi:MAG: hypothetical protein RR346_04305 [Bacteroidales bacterium]